MRRTSRKGLATKHVVACRSSSTRCGSLYTGVVGLHGHTSLTWLVGRRTPNTRRVCTRCTMATTSPVGCSPVYLEARTPQVQGWVKYAAYAVAAYGAAPRNSVSRRHITRHRFARLASGAGSLNRPHNSADQHHTLHTSFACSSTRRRVSVYSAV